MTKNDLRAFAELMTTMRETYGNAQESLSAAKIDLYFKALEDIPIDALLSGVVQLTRTKIYNTFPLPAEIRIAVEGRPEEQDRARANIAFDGILQAIGMGTKRPDSFEDPAQDRAFHSMGGWDAILDWETKDRNWHRKDFVALYTIYDHHARRPELAAPRGKALPGTAKMLTGKQPREENDGR